MFVILDFFWNLQQIYCLERINSYLINLSPLRGSFLNNTMRVENFPKKIEKMFEITEEIAEFVILLLKQPKCKSEQMRLSLLQNGWSLSHCPFALIVGAF